MYLDAEHAAVRADGLLALFAVILHFNLVLLAFLFRLFIRVHGVYHVLYLIDEALTVCKPSQGEYFPAMGTFGPGVFNPLSETVFTCEFGAGRAHPGFFDCVETDVALKEGCVVGWI